jgi:hypothetical protein
LPQSEDTAFPHSQDEEKERARLIKLSISKQAPRTINKNENPRGYRLRTVSGKTICHSGFKPGSMEQASSLPISSNSVLHGDLPLSTVSSAFNSLVEVVLLFADTE